VKNEELHNLYSSTNTVRVITSKKTRWARCIVCMEEIRESYNVQVGIPEGRRPLGTPEQGREDNNKIDIKEIV
jgi:hypothetical protein